jgi:putative hydrolase of the HAD superfamily
MNIKVDTWTCLVFDLDDTLYCEIDYLKSAYREISCMIDEKESDKIYAEIFDIYISGGNPFLFITEKHPSKILTLEKLLYLYRNHLPVISPKDGVIKMLTGIKRRGGQTGIITDGRSISQRNKIKALGIESYIDLIIISEEAGESKPSETLYRNFMKNREVNNFYYFGDNPEKDFVTPNKLGWTTIGVEGCYPVHKNRIEGYPKSFQPLITINDFKDIRII